MKKITEYDKAIDKLISDFIPKEEGMSDKYYNKFINDVFETSGITKKFLKEQLKIGVDGGVSIKEQISRIETILKDKNPFNN